MVLFAAYTVKDRDASRLSRDGDPWSRVVLWGRGYGHAPWHENCFRVAYFYFFRHKPKIFDKPCGCIVGLA